MRTEHNCRVVSKPTHRLRCLKGLLGLSLFLAFLAAGCEHDYQWTEYKIKTDRISAGNTLSAGPSVSVTAGASNDERQKLGFLGGHRYFGSLRQLTDAVVTQVSQELSTRGVKVADGAAKTIEITVSNSTFTEGSWMLRAEMDVHVKTGNGYTRDIHVSNRTPGTVPGALDGAVALATIEVLNDARIIDYLKQ